MSSTTGLGFMICWMLASSTVLGASPLASVTLPASAAFSDLALSPL
jgi:hypothetical protein